MEGKETKAMEKCPKCNDAMEKGRLAGMIWMYFASDEERRKFIGRGARVEAYRCVSCGYCEIYAPGKPKL